MDSFRKRRPPRRQNHRHMPGTVAAAYVVLGALWIVASDTVLDWVATGRIEVVRYQTWKGWFFILVTGIILYLILAGAWRRARATKTQLDLALSSAGGGIWDRDLVEQTIFVSPHLKTLLALPSDRDFTTPEEWRELIHPDDLDAVRANTRRALMDAQFEPFVHYRIRHGDGSYRWIQSRGHVLRNRRNQPIRMVGVVLDVTQQVEGRASVHQQVTYDAMTGLLNRETFGVKLARMLDEKRENPVDEKDAAALIRLSLRQFGDVNNAYGFTIGDQVLRRFGRRLIETAGSSALVGRIAGDEFAIALPSTASTPGADRSIDRIAESGHEPMRLEGRDIHLNPAIGVAFYPADGDTAETLLSAAGLALQRARETPELPVCY